MPLSKTISCVEQGVVHCTKYIKELTSILSLVPHNTWDPPVLVPILKRVKQLQYRLSKYRTLLEHLIERHGPS